jgi:hypothetical protein
MPSVHRIVICFFSDTYAALKRKKMLVLFGIRIMYLRGETYLPNGQSFQGASTVKTQVRVLPTYIISMKWNLFSLWNMWRYAHLALTTITQLYLTFVTFLKYYQFIYIIIWLACPFVICIVSCASTKTIL